MAPLFRVPFTLTLKLLCFSPETRSGLPQRPPSTAAGWGSRSLVPLLLLPSPSPTGWLTAKAFSLGGASMSLSSCSTASGGCGDHHDAGSIMSWGQSRRGDHRSVGSTMSWGSSWCGDHCDVGTITVWGPPQCGDHHGAGTIAMRGPSQCGDHHGAGTIAIRGASWHGDHHVMGTITAQGAS